MIRELISAISGAKTLLKVSLEVIKRTHPEIKIDKQLGKLRLTYNHQQQINKADNQSLIYSYTAVKKIGHKGKETTTTEKLTITLGGRN